MFPAREGVGNPTLAWMLVEGYTMLEGVKGGPKVIRIFNVEGTFKRARNPEFALFVRFFQRALGDFENDSVRTGMDEVLDAMAHRNDGFEGVH